MTLILDVVFGVVYLFVLISYSGLLTAVSLSVVPLYLAMVFVVAPLIKRQLRIAAEANAAASALMVESLTEFRLSKPSMLRPPFDGVGSSAMRDSYPLIFVQLLLVRRLDL